MARRYSARQSQRLQKSDLYPVVKPRWRLIWLFALLALWLICSGATPFHPLSYRLAQYPNWKTKPPTETVNGDLLYPDWFEGTWRVSTTLIDAIAPLAPEVVTPGFDGNQDYLNQSVTFLARFVEPPEITGRSVNVMMNSPENWWRSPQSLFKSSPVEKDSTVIADRAFNGLNLMRASLNQMTPGMGDRLVNAVAVDPDNPNRQITRMEGDRQLISTVVGRRTESPDAAQFITTEVFQQVFRGIPQPYVNEVETTTDYRYTSDKTSPITANQVTAIYLSPQDPDYFKAGDRPVALYRYCLEFSPELARVPVAVANMLSSNGHTP
ncbi:MAG: DUF6816 family protein [Cyanobacteria bacterium J06627_8]